jgi:acetyl-CoA acetyltransferase
MREMLSRPRPGSEPVDDVAVGCVTPVGGEGADIAKTAAINPGPPDTVVVVQLKRQRARSRSPSCSGEGGCMNTSSPAPV